MPKKFNDLTKLKYQKLKMELEINLQLLELLETLHLNLNHYKN